MSDHEYVSAMKYLHSISDRVYRAVHNCRYEVAVSYNEYRYLANASSVPIDYDEDSDIKITPTRLRWLILNAYRFEEREFKKRDIIRKNNKLVKDIIE